MALAFKAGVDIRGVRPEAVLAMYVVDGIYRAAGALGVVVTSVKDSKHMEHSLHYQGLAFDARLPSRVGAKIADVDVARRLREALGAQFDVVLESDHIHVEFDPK
jgi:hypothetical protein